MANVEVVIYNVAAFVCALFVLEFGADKFVDHSAVVAKRLGVSPTVVALLTAGAEWEELVVVVLSISQHRSSLAIGNIVGSNISNILGAFSLGLIFSPAETEVINFDRSAKLYCAILLLVTCITSGLLAFQASIEWRALGGVFIGAFVIYVISLFWAIGRGTLTAPELSDSDDSGSSDESDDEESAPIVNSAGYRTFGAGGSSSSTASRPNSVAQALSKDARHGLGYHLSYLLAGIAALILSAYVLSRAASSIVEATGISDVFFGVVVLSFATTLPEKLVAVISGSRGHAEVMVASTVGSNIFLLTLCMGILWAATGNDFNQGSVSRFEIVTMLLSAVAMSSVVWRGVRWPRLVGSLMLVAYVAFVAVEAIAASVP